MPKFQKINLTSLVGFLLCLMTMNDFLISGKEKGAIALSCPS
jgi:hypothetical protein